MIYLVEIEHYSGTVETLYTSTHRLAPFPPDDPDRPNILYVPRVMDPGNFSRFLFTKNSLYSQGSGNGGIVVLANTDGGLDSLIHEGFDGREVRIYITDGKKTNWSEYTLVMVGTITQVVFSISTMVLTIRDRKALLDKPIQTSRFLGTNALPNGVEGVPGDLQGVVKPQCYGKVFNVSPPIVNTSKLIYQVHDGQIEGVQTVYDKGVALTQGANRTDLATLLTSTPTAGQWDYCNGSGVEGAYFRLGSSPSGTITADIHGDKYGGVYRTSVSDLLKSIATRNGLTTFDEVVF